MQNPDYSYVTAESKQNCDFPFRLMDEIKGTLREEQTPYFSDFEIRRYINKYYNGTPESIERIIYEMALVKAEDSSIQISGLTTADNSQYYRRLAARYRPINTGILGG